MTCLWPCDRVRGSDFMGGSEGVLDALQLLLEQGLLLDKVAHRAVVRWQARLAEVMAEVLDEEPFHPPGVREPHRVRQLMQVLAHDGHIVNISATAATRAWGNAAAYHASKWGLVGFSRGLGVEGREHGIKVTTVIPGGMRTHWFDSFPEQGIPMPDEAHLQDPRNVAEVILLAVQMPAQSSMQEVIVTPVTETSWP